MIRGVTVALQPFDRPHLERTRTWINDPEISSLLGRAKPVSDIQHEEWFAALNGRHDTVWFAIIAEGAQRHIGNVWLWDIDTRHRKAEIRVVLGDREHTGRGMGTEAIALTCAYAFQRLNLHKVYADVLARNARALRAFQKAGFAVEGVLKEDRWDGDGYTDVYRLGRLR
jgi:RimJ/RimL family protein N-acetyltransferase